MNLAIVTGQFRTGTSAVAQILQRLYVPMATSIAPPQWPFIRSDWEDWTLTQAMFDILPYGTEGLAGNMIDKFAMWFPGYLEERVQLAACYGAAVGKAPAAIGVKSPLLSPFIPTAVKIARDCGFENVLHIGCCREPQALNRSIIHTFSPVNMTAAIFKMNALIRRNQHAVSLAVPLEELVENPTRWTTRMATLLGIDMDWSMIEHAASAIENGVSPCLSGAQR